MKNLKCMFGSHKWKILAVNREFSTRYENLGTQNWNIDFSVCTRCGARKAFDNVVSGHHGVDAAKRHWKLEGVVPFGTKYLEDISVRIIDDEPELAEVITFDLIKGGKDE